MEDLRAALNTRDNNDLWARAIEKIPPQDRVHINFSYDKLTVVSNLKAEVEATQQRCKDNRWHLKRKSGEKVILRDLFAKVVKWIDLFRQVGDTIVQHDPGHAALPWALVRFILQATVNDIEKYEFVTENLEVVSRCICRCKIIEQLYLSGNATSVQQLESSLVSLYGAVLLCLSSFKRYFDQNDSARFVLSIIRDKKVFEVFMNEINEGLDDVHQCAALVRREDECSRYRELKHIIEEFNTPLRRISDQLQTIQDNLQDSKRRSILEWMSNIEKVPYLKHHKESKRQILPGTGNWLLEEDTFRKWKDDSASSLLWLHGIPGSGKSKLTSLVIEDAMQSASKGQTSRPIYFYCSRNPAEPLRSDSNAILGSLTRQLASLDPTSALFPPAVEKYAEEEAQGGASGSLDIEDSCDLMSQLINLYPTAVIIIDALDECTGQSRVDILDFVKSTLDDSSCLVKFFISSREDEEIVYQLNNFPNVDISSTKNQADIEAFVESETKKLVKRGTLLRNSRQKEILKEEIIRKISKDATGMFRWASMQLQNLATLKTDEDIQSHLGRIPPSLEALYMEIYDNISTHHGTNSKTLAGNTFCLLLRLRENLLPSEFMKLVQTSSKDHLSANTILDICCNLVVLDKTLKVFRFAHLSVREFFEKLPEYSPQRSHSIVASTSIGYIDIEKRSEWLKKYAREPIRTVGDYIAFWLIYHFQLSGNLGQNDSLLFKASMSLASRQDLSEFRADVQVLFLKRMECRPLIPKNINHNLLLLFNTCAIGFSDIFKAFVVNVEALPTPSLKAQLHQDLPWIFSEGFRNLKEISAKLSLEGLKGALTPGSFHRLALHSISHGNYTILRFLLTEKLCQVTEAMLLQAVNAYDIRKTCGSDWREPAVITDLLLESAFRERMPGILTSQPIYSLEWEAPFKFNVVSTEIHSVLKDLLTPVVIQKAITTLRVDKDRGITCTVMKILSKWGAKVVLTHQLLDVIAQLSSNPTETLTLLLDSHEDLIVPFRTLEPMASVPIYAPTHIRRLFSKCPISDLTQDVFQLIIQNDIDPEFATCMVSQNPRLIINERFLILAARVHKVTEMVNLVSRFGESRESPIQKENLFTKDLLMAAAGKSGNPDDIVTVLDGNPLLSVTEELVMAVVQNYWFKHSLFSNLAPKAIKALETLQRVGGAHFRITNKVLEAAVDVKVDINVDVLEWLIDEGSGYSNSWAEKTIINVIGVSHHKVDSYRQISLFQSMQKKTAFILTQSILHACLREVALDCKKYGYLLGWFFEHCESCMDRQHTMNKLIMDRRWVLARALNLWDEDIEISSDCQKCIQDAMEDYPQEQEMLQKSVDENLQAPKYAAGTVKEAVFQLSRFCPKKRV